jgi:hypothetical protein
VFQELATVVVRTLLTERRHITGTEGSSRQPQPGDLGTIVALLGPKACAVECVDSSGQTVWLTDFDFDELCKVLGRWTFELTEVSPAVYSATGLGPRGETVCSTDTDPDKVLRDCRLFALRRSPA